MISKEEVNLLQQENQALREKADLLQEKSHLLQQTVSLQEETISLQGQLIGALQKQVMLLTQQAQSPHVSHPARFLLGLERFSLGDAHRPYEKE